MQQHMKLLGLKVKDKVTGFRGVVTSIGFDLYGCVQAVVHPGLDDKGQPLEGKWFDTNRLTAIDEKPVMAVPSFGRPVEQLAGPADKPASASKPTR